MDRLNRLLKEVSEILLKEKTQQQERRKRGECFNIFEVLGLQTSEVRLHSAILAELLSPYGDHGLGDRFLKAFIQDVVSKNCEFTMEILHQQKSTQNLVSETFLKTTPKVVVLTFSFKIRVKVQLSLKTRFMLETNHTNFLDTTITHEKNYLIINTLFCISLYMMENNQVKILLGKSLLNTSVSATRMTF